MPFLSESDWNSLIEQIRAGRCVPVIGAGATAGIVPLGSEMAQSLANEHRYPFDDADTLPSVTEYLAVKYDPTFPKQTVLKTWFQSIELPDLRASDEPHSVLADLPLPLYLTTNYDDLMVQALRLRGKQPHRVICPWNDASRAHLAQQSPDISADKPIVFHMHGCDELPESLVITETDYVDFLAYFTNRLDDLFPDYVRHALSTSILLIIGYSLADVNFRTILRSFARKEDESLHNFSVQYPGPDDDEKRGYIEEYFAKSMNLRVIWAPARDFATELRQRFEAG